MQRRHRTQTAPAARGQRPPQRYHLFRRSAQRLRRYCSPACSPGPPSARWEHGVTCFHPRIFLFRHPQAWGWHSPAKRNAQLPAHRERQLEQRRCE